MVSRLPASGYVLGLDVGKKRIGAAVASVIAKLPQPISVVGADGTEASVINDLIKKEDIRLIVVGIPRNLEGEETQQSAEIRSFAQKLTENINIPIVFADESLSSKRAESLMKKNSFKNVSSDSLAACFILEEFFATI